MKYLMLFALILGVDLSTSYADLGETSTTPIDAQALKNRRLFFDAEQRELRSRDKKLVKSTARPSVSDQNSEAVNTIKLNADKVLHYTGVIHSDRGVQLLLNGYPWQQGQLNVIAARLQPHTLQIEVEMASGEIYRLLPGDTVEIKP